MKISFTTLGCPEWSWEKIVKTAVSLGYEGLEIRGVNGEMNISRIPQFMPENISDTLSQLKQNNLEIRVFGTSCIFHEEDRFDASINEGKESIDLASKMGVPYIRVFGDNIPQSERKTEIFDRIAKGIGELCNYAENKGVTVLLEVHGDFNSAENLKEIIDRVNSPDLGILWDIGNSDMIYGDKFIEFYTEMKPYIKHLHIKDHKRDEGKYPLCMIGEGDIPICSIVKCLKEDKFDGYLSLEWEKKWHPELEDAEIAFPAYINYIRKCLS